MTEKSGTREKRREKGDLGLNACPVPWCIVGKDSLSAAGMQPCNLDARWYGFLVVLRAASGSFRDGRFRLSGVGSGEP